MKPLTEMTAEELDEFAAWAHAAEQTEHVTIVHWPAGLIASQHGPQDEDARHGLNTEDETAV